jgi:hypothetical protein
MSKSILPEVIAAATNRRSFLKKMGAASAAVGAMSVGAAVPAEAQSTTEVDILNFALNLEYLEAEFYTYALDGTSITNYGIGIDGVANSPNPTSGGPAVGGKKVSFSNNLVFTEAIGRQIGSDERAHVKLLRQVLGAKAIAQPNINLNALGFGFGSENEFLKLARIFEDIGVTAYGGAAAMLTTPLVINYAARILAVEAEHVSSIRTQIARLNISTAPPLDGVDILPPPSGAQDQYLSVNVTDGLTSTRTPGQVLYLAYGMKANAGSGGFFPTGVNGAITMSSTAATPTPANS